jgi:hypothetical protein
VANGRPVLVLDAHCHPTILLPLLLLLHGSHGCTLCTSDLMAFWELGMLYNMMALQRLSRNTRSAFSFTVMHVGGTFAGGAKVSSVTAGGDVSQTIRFIIQYNAT